jgi:hypothetical protein
VIPTILPGHYEEIDDFKREHQWDGYMDDDEDYEWEVEEHEYTAPGVQAHMIKIRLSLTHAEEEEVPWMEDFHARCSCNGATVATAKARYIDRERIRSHFWQQMEEPSEEMSKLAFEVFDQSGTVKSNFMDHPVQRGTGAWGDELDPGPLFLIKELHVTALEYRQKGLGQRIVSLLLDKALGYFELIDQLAKSYRQATGSAAQPLIFHALVLPGRLNADAQLQSVGKSVREILDMNAQALGGTLQFWRKCGFRRIGASKCLAFSFAPQHPSRALAVASDFDPNLTLATISRMKSSIE